MDSAFINLDNFNSQPFELYQNLNVNNQKSQNMTSRITKSQLSELYFSETNIDYLLLLSWNLKKEIIKQEKNFVKNGGKFIIPFPSPKILKI